MDVKASRRFTNKRERSFFNSLGQLEGGGGSWPTKKVICFYHLEGRCNRNPCRFLHVESPAPHVNRKIAKQIPEDVPKKSYSYNRPKKSYSYNRPKNIWVSSGSEDRNQDLIKRNRNYTAPKKLASSTGNDESGNTTITQKTTKNVCEHWMSGNCVRGDECKFLHSWYRGDGFSMLAKLDGHKKAVCGIALPLGSEKLYSGSRDGTVRLWDCYTGQCASVINLGAEVGSLICEGPWVFAGMPNFVKAWNIDSSAEHSLNGPVGQVYSMVVGNEMLFAGAQDGDILAWKGNPGAKDPFQLAAFLRAHTHAVTCLAVGASKLYSGSMDNTIRVWDLDTLELVMTLDDHTDAPMSLLCWDQYLLSCSLDQTIKVWVATEAGNLEVAYTHNEDHGLLALCGMNDAEGKPVLICSCNDNSVRLYELPSFIERGRIFSKREVKALQIGPDGLFFTGDGTGMLSVWKLSPKPSEEMS